MPAYVKIGDIKGEATDSGHKDWLLIESMNSPIHRTIAPGVKDNQRSRGETVLGDISIIRTLDKSSPKLAEACANGTLYPEVQIDLTTQFGKENRTYLTYSLKNCIVTSYSFHGSASAQPQPTETVTLSFTDIEWKYTILNPDSGQPQGNVVTKFSPAKNA